MPILNEQGESLVAHCFAFYAAQDADEEPAKTEDKAALLKDCGLNPVVLVA